MTTAAILALMVVCTAIPANAQAPDSGALHPNGMLLPVKVGASPVLRDMDLDALRLQQAATKPQEINPREINRHNSEMPERIANARKPDGPVDTAVQSAHGPLVMPPPIMNFEGVNNINGVLPPDTQGDVGVTYYVQWVNLSFDIYDKTTGLSVIGGPAPGNSLWSGFGGSCETNNTGDPITLYDHLADRWFMSQFTGDNHQCIAVSQTNDPTGAWWLYDYLADAGSGFFPDYPKFGVWPDGYYYTASMFGDGSNMSGVFERDAMLNGDPALFIWFFVQDTAAFPSWRALPSDLDGANLPPAGAPNPILQLVDDAWGYDPPYDEDGIAVIPLHVDWAVPGNSTFGPPEFIDLTAAGYPLDSTVCDAFRGQCVPQPGGPDLETLQGQLMYRLQYRNFGSYETLVTSQTVDADGTSHAGVRWYELRNSGGGWGVNQAGTYAPDSDHRWMADAAMDTSGNIAVGFSVSSTTTFPTIRWAGRLIGDPLDTLAQGEDTVIAGGGSQTHSAARWGDYSSMSVDPVDDCTFWYTTEYIATTGSAPWQTRIASFKFPSCSTGPSGTVEGFVTEDATTDPIEGATVEVGAFATATDAAGFYSITVPVDTYDVTASKFGFVPHTHMGIVVDVDEVVTQDFALVQAASAFFSGNVTDAGHGWALYASVQLKTGGMTVGTLYTNPFTGYYQIELPEGMIYDFTVTPMAPGYDPMMRAVLMPPAGQTEDFMFMPISPSCTAPGYAGNAANEDFEGAFPPAGWTVNNLGGTCDWESTATTGRGNFTGGSGDAADADSDWCGSGTTMDTELLSPVVDVSAMATVIVEFKYDYNNLSSSEIASAEISGDGGATWNTLVSWNTDQRGPATFSQDVTGLVGGSTQVQLRFYHLAPGWDWWFEIDDVTIFDPTATCDLVPGSLVAGFVSDANTADPLNGATVADDVGGMADTMPTPDDPNIGDGFYEMFTPEAPAAPLATTFTASASGYADEMAVIDLVLDVVNQLDFALGAGWLEVTPTHLDSLLFSGETEDQAISIINHGTVDANVGLGVIPVTNTFVHASPVTDTSNLPGNTAPVSMGPALAAPGTPISAPNPDLLLASVPAYGVDALAANFVEWPDVTIPGAWNVVGGGMGQFFAGDFLLGDFSKMYILDYATNTLITVDTASAAQTTIGPATPGAGESWSGLTGAVDGTLYASGTTCAASTLYTVDPATGATTAVGPISNGPCIIDISINAAGELFGVDIVNDVLVQIDPATGAGTVIGSTGVAANYAQGMDFDEVSGILYWASYTSQGELRILDTMTGASTLVGAFPGGTEVTAFGIATSAGGGGLPWLELTPTEGVVPADEGELPINAEFIADGADHFGLYKANIMVMNDTPYEVNDVSVCFTKAFNDVPVDAFAQTQIHSMAGARITGGCGLGNYCPTDITTRGVMARWLIKSMFGPDYSPPPCVGIFADVVCEGTANSNYIEALFNEGVTAGCNADPLMYCPDAPVLRSQMAVFLLKALEGSEYVPPPCAGIFTDVSCPAGFAVDWIEEFFNRGITAGCGVDLYCPSSDTSRAEMGVFEQKTFDFPMCEE